MEKIECITHLKESGDWLRIDQDGQSKIVLIASGSELAQVLKLVTTLGKNLKTTFEVVE